MDRKNSIDKDLAALDELIEEITTDAYGDDEQLWAFRLVIEDDVTLPADGFVIANRSQLLRSTMAVTQGAG
jgi:hypothetical protein